MEKHQQHADEEEVLVGEGSESCGPWAEMAPDLLSNIFRRLPLQQLLTVIPCVCKLWKAAALNPLCYQILDLHIPGFLPRHALHDLTKVLLCRSQGGLLEITMTGHIPCKESRRCLYLIARSAPLLQKLHIPDSFANDKWATYAAPLMPRIVDLDISGCDNRLSSEAIEAFGKNCKLVKKLRRNRPANQLRKFLSNDSEALAIAQHYPCLEHLELEGNPLSEQGLKAILGNCPFLKSLNVNRCVHLSDMDSSLLEECRMRLQVFCDAFLTYEREDRFLIYDDGGDYYSEDSEDRFLIYDDRGDYYSEDREESRLYYEGFCYDYQWYY